MFFLEEKRHPREIFEQEKSERNQKRHPREIKDHVNNACLRGILMRSGSRHLVDICTWLIVAHQHARTSSHSAETLNLCLSGKELSSMFHLSLFPVTCAWKRSRVACDGVGLLLDTG